ncbi:glycosyltransferase [Thomasclavelia sp.]|uniref:glycosyltransferase n=1 Tax=Thomasclavelia sp. TaxID=3025757 RepID=UPI0025E18A02|nr:glycosyltransferase [Thomasclavelia sp.]
MDIRINIGGIVTFNPNILELEKNIKAVYNSLEVLIIVDNGSTNIKDLKELLLNFENIILIELNENKGIAFALNVIVYKAKDLQYEWVLLLDQDSICDEKLMENYKNYLTKNLDDKIALLTPFIIDINKISFEEYKGYKLPTTSKVSFAITSASLIRIDVFEYIGGFDNDLFIDCVDIDYSKRLELNDYKQIRINTTYLLQQVGKAEKTRIYRIHKDNAGSLTIQPYYRTNHSLTRQYYMARNNIIIVRKYYRGLRKIKKYLFVYCYLLAKVLVEKNRIKLFKTQIKGILDGYKYPTICYRKGCSYE